MEFDEMELIKNSAMPDSPQIHYIHLLRSRFNSAKQLINLICCCLMRQFHCAKTLIAAIKPNQIINVAE